MSLARNILVATDFSEPAEKATRYALELAQKHDAKVHLVHAWTVPVLTAPEGVTLPAALFTQIEQEAQRAMAAALQRHRTPGVALEGTVMLTDPRDAVTDLAQKLGADLVVIGTHGRRGLKRALLGSVAEGVVRSAPCPVLVVR